MKDMSRNTTKGDAMLTEIERDILTRAAEHPKGFAILRGSHRVQVGRRLHERGLLTKPDYIVPGYVADITDAGRASLKS